MADLIDGIYGDAEALDVGMIARKLGMNPESLRRRIRQGDLAAVCMGGRWRVGRRALARFLACRPGPHRPPTAWTPSTAYRHGPADPNFEEEPPPLDMEWEDPPDGSLRPTPF